MAMVNGELWSGNFGDGKINNYDPTTGAFLETLTRADGTPLQLIVYGTFFRSAVEFISQPELPMKPTACSA